MTCWNSKTTQRKSKNLTAKGKKTDIKCELMLLLMIHTHLLRTNYTNEAIFKLSMFVISVPLKWAAAKIRVQMSCCFWSTNLKTRSSITDCWTCWNRHLDDCNNSHLSERLWHQSEDEGKEMNLRCVVWAQRAAVGVSMWTLGGHGLRHNSSGRQVYIEYVFNGMI